MVSAKRSTLNRLKRRRSSSGVGGGSPGHQYGRALLPSMVGQGYLTVNQNLMCMTPGENRSKTSLTTTERVWHRFATTQRCCYFGHLSQQNETRWIFARVFDLMSMAKSHSGRKAATSRAAVSPCRGWPGGNSLQGWMDVRLLPMCSRKLIKLGRIERRGQPQGKQAPETASAGMATNRGMVHRQPGVPSNKYQRRNLPEAAPRHR